MVFSIFREIRLSLPVACDYRDYHNFFCLNDNHYFAIIANFFVSAIIAKIVDQIDSEMKREKERRNRQERHMKR
jgi:hypothetical protein